MFRSLISTVLLRWYLHLRAREMKSSKHVLFIAHSWMWGCQGEKSQALEIGTTGFNSQSWNLIIMGTGKDSSSVCATVSTFIKWGKDTYFIGLVKGKKMN